MARKQMQSGGPVPPTAPMPKTTRAAAQAKPVHEKGTTSNEIGQTVPSRLLTTHTINRKSAVTGTIAPAKLVEHARPFGAKS